VIYSIWEASENLKQWVQIENMSLLSLYFKRQVFFLSFSYALAGAFTIYALQKFLQSSKNGLIGVVGGITLTGILYIGGCFLLGCCGFPILAFYLNLSKIPLTTSFIFIIIYVYMCNYESDI
jgi:hypothetical protein